MPLYEYECDACHHRFEIIQKFSDAPVEKCPVCGGPVHKLQSAPAFQFKGSGWYITDYARKGASSGEGSANGAKSGSAEKSETSEKSEKPAKDSKTADSSTSESSTSTSTSAPASNTGTK
jgi:putative FmdB family regulatory protein